MPIMWWKNCKVRVKYQLQSIRDEASGKSWNAGLEYKDKTILAVSKFEIQNEGSSQKLEYVAILIISLDF